MKKIIFLDIDDTIIFNGQFPDNYLEIKKKIKEAKKSGYKVGICTNRTYDTNVKNIRKVYNLNRIILTESGAVYHHKYFNDDLIKNINVKLYKYLRNNLKEYNVELSTRKKSDIKLIRVSKGRKVSTSLLLFKMNNFEYNNIYEYIRNIDFLEKYTVEKDIENKKIYIYNKDVNKIDGMNKFFKDDEIYFITDIEALPLPKYKNINVYSVGKDNKFNKYASKTFKDVIDAIDSLIGKE